MDDKSHSFAFIAWMILHQNIMLIVNRLHVIAVQGQSGLTGRVSAIRKIVRKKFGDVKYYIEIHMQCLCLAQQGL